MLSRNPGSSGPPQNRQARVVVNAAMNYSFLGDEKDSNLM